MFTGIIEGLCEAKSVTGSADALRLKIELGGLAEGCKADDSIAVNGVCLTVTALENTTASFDVGIETLSKSNLGGLRAGSTSISSDACSAGTWAMPQDTST